ncbi:MAG: hypothetical protein HKL81_01810 [Acidimicrobiaceae bacterium]|nr:hypothetical protein [Acidimicrobiaceae bacterium]
MATGKATKVKQPYEADALAERRFLMLGSKSIIPDPPARPITSHQVGLAHGSPVALLGTASVCPLVTGAPEGSLTGILLLTVVVGPLAED